VAMGQILGFSIGFRRRPYNTLAVISFIYYYFIIIIVVAITKLSSDAHSTTVLQSSKHNFRPVFRYYKYNFTERCAIEF